MRRIKNTNIAFADMDADIIYETAEEIIEAFGAVEAKRVVGFLSSSCVGGIIKAAKDQQFPSEYIDKSCDDYELLERIERNLSDNEINIMTYLYHRKEKPLTVEEKRFFNANIENMRIATEDYKHHEARWRNQIEL